MEKAVMEGIPLTLEQRNESQADEIIHKGGCSMTLIVKNANLTNLAKTTEAVATWMKKHGGRKRITVEWLTPNGCMVYSNGEADKEVINVRG